MFPRPRPSAFCRPLSLFDPECLTLHSNTPQPFQAALYLLVAQVMAASNSSGSLFSWLFFQTLVSALLVRHFASPLRKTSHALIWLVFQTSIIWLLPDSFYFFHVCYPSDTLVYDAPIAPFKLCDRGTYMYVFFPLTLNRVTPLSHANGWISLRPPLCPLFFPYLFSSLPSLLPPSQSLSRHYTIPYFYPSLLPQFLSLHRPFFPVRYPSPSFQYRVRRWWQISLRVLLINVGRID